MEDLGIKAIVIGVSLFVTVMTLSAIILYFNSAREVADVVSERTDIASSFDSIVNGDNFEDTLTGVEIRSLINKYSCVEQVEINIIAVSGISTDSYKNINNKTIDDGGWLVQLNETASLISEEKLNLINPVWNCEVNKVENSGRTILNISLNVKE